MVERLLGSTRYLVVITVVVSVVSALLLYVVSVTLLTEVIYETLVQLPEKADLGKEVAVQLLKVLDILLIAVTFQIIASGLYRLFISHRELTPADDELRMGRLEITNFHQLKATVIHLAVVILVIQFLEHAVNVGAALETLYFGAASALVIAAAVWAADRIVTHH